MLGQMSKNPQKIHRVAISLARMLKDCPEMTWEDAQALYSHSNWAYSDFLYDDLSASANLEIGPGKIRRSDLKEAWELAQAMSQAATP